MPTPRPDSMDPPSARFWRDAATILATARVVAELAANAERARKAGRLGDAETLTTIATRLQRIDRGVR